MSDHEVLAPTQDGATLPAAAGTLADMLPAIKAKMETMQAIQQYIDRKVDPKTDFNTVGGKICRNHSYAKKVFGVVGGDYEWLKDVQGRPLVVKDTYSDDEGQYYVYEAFARYRPPGGQWFEGSGMFSSRDKFFGRKSGEFKEVSAVDERSVRQAAQTECFKKCIFSALGYGDASEAEMVRCGVDTSGSKGHTFRKGNQGGNTDSEDEGDKRAEVKQMCTDLYNAAFQPEDVDAFGKPEDVLKYLTKSKTGSFSGWNNFEKISAKGLNITHKQIKAVFDEAMKNDF